MRSEVCDTGFEVVTAGGPETVVCVAGSNFVHGPVSSVAITAMVSSGTVACSKIYQSRMEYWDTAFECR